MFLHEDSGERISSSLEQRQVAFEEVRKQQLELDMEQQTGSK